MTRKEKGRGEGGKKKASKRKRGGKYGQRGVLNPQFKIQCTPLQQPSAMWLLRLTKFNNNKNTIKTTKSQHEKYYIL